MKCPYYKNPQVKQKFNKLVTLYGGAPLTDAEFENSNLRTLRKDDDYYAVNTAYYMWDKHDEDYIDAVIDLFEHPNSKSSIDKILRDFNKTVLEKVVPNSTAPSKSYKMLHIFKGQWYVTAGRNRDRQYLYEDTDELLGAAEYVKRKLLYYIYDNNLPFSGVDIEDSGKINLLTDNRTIQLDEQLIDNESYEDVSEDEYLSRIALLEQELRDEDDAEARDEINEEILRIEGKIKMKECEW